MKENRKELYTNVVFETYSNVAPALVHCGKEIFFTLHDIEIYFDTRDASLLNHRYLGQYLPNDNAIILFLGNIYNAGESLAYYIFRSPNKLNSEIDVYYKEKSMISIITHTLINELFRYNSYIPLCNDDCDVRGNLKALTLSFLLSHYSQIKNMINIYDEVILQLMSDELVGDIIKNINDNTVNGIIKYAINNIDTIIKENTPQLNCGRAVYQPIDSINYLSRIMYAMYHERLSNKEAFPEEDSRFTNVDDLMNFVKKFNDDYNATSTVKIEFDILVPPKNKRVSRYALLKSNGVNQNEVLSVERIFHDIRKPAEKKMHINSKRLNVMNNQDLYSALTSVEILPGRLVNMVIDMDYTITNNEMIIYLKNLE